MVVLVLFYFLKPDISENIRVRFYHMNKNMWSGVELVRHDIDVLLHNAVNIASDTVHLVTLSSFSCEKYNVEDLDVKVLDDFMMNFGKCIQYSIFVHDVLDPFYFDCNVSICSRKNGVWNFLPRVYCGKFLLICNLIYSCKTKFFESKYLRRKRVAAERGSHREGVPTVEETV